MTEQGLLSIMSGRAKGPGPALVRALSAAAAPLYALGAAAKNGVYDAGWAQTHDLGRPAVSVGNLTTGGTGKTPMVAWVVRQLAQAGHRPCILLRGYKSKNGVSDEAEELRQMVGDVAQVAPNPDRVAEAARQLAAHPGITCFVLDDGFQHRRARRNLDLVLVDATNPWGYGWTLPRGLLREGKRNLRRADAVVVTRCDRVAPERLAQVCDEVKAVAGLAPLALARHGWEGFRVWKGGREEEAPLDALRAEKIAAVCGIGNPHAFLAQAEACAGKSVLVDSMPDHFAWDVSMVAGFLASASVKGASAVLTTEKDFVKWRPLLSLSHPMRAALEFDLPIFRPRLAMEFPRGGDALATLLASRISLLSGHAS